VETKVESEIVVSVLMTSYNREQYIAEAIESVLASDFEDFELIIVDDASTDNTVSIARSYEQSDSCVNVYINENNLGDYPNRNRAASYAKGKYIKYVDSDDKILPHALSVMVSAMEGCPMAAFGFSDCHPGENKEYPTVYTGEQALRKHFTGGGLLQAGPSTAIIRREVFNRMGGFSGKRYISDYEMWLHMCLYYPVVIFEPGLVWVRAHEGQEMDIGKLPYYHLNYKLHKEFITNTPNPFTVNERKRLIFNYRVLLGRRIYQRLLKWFGIKKTLETIENAGENASIFLVAFLPMKKLEYKDGKR
jgi:glycosyltransferase involved in cell wall biosynthesis